MDKWKKKLFKLCLWLFIASLCSYGFIIQVKHISNRYFDYKTRTVVQMILPIELIFPSISTCWGVNDLLNLTMVNSAIPNRSSHTFNQSKGIIKRWNSIDFDWDEFYSLIDNFSTADMFDFTPIPNQILDRSFGCRIRLPEEYVPRILNASTCHEMFEIKKYFEREHICYQFDLINNDESIDMIEYTMAPGWTGVMFELIFNANIFQTIRILSLSSHSVNSSHILDSMFSFNQYLTGKAKPSARLHYRQISRIKLKAPYQTKCQSIQDGYETGLEYMLNQINNETIDELGISIPFIATYNDSANYRKVISYKYFQDKNFLTVLNQKMNRSYRKECHTMFHITTADVSDDDNVSVAVYWRQDEKLVLRYVSKIDLIDYIVYVCSYIGIWFGLSAFSMFDIAIFVTDVTNLEAKHSQKKYHAMERNMETMAKKINSMEMKIFLLNQLTRQLMEFIDFESFH